jgi:hypothetical protein
LEQLILPASLGVKQVTARVYSHLLKFPNVQEILTTIHLIISNCVLSNTVLDKTVLGEALPHYSKICASIGFNNNNLTSVLTFSITKM